MTSNITTSGLDINPGSLTELDETSLIGLELLYEYQIVFWVKSTPMLSFLYYHTHLNNDFSWANNKAKF